MTDVIITDMSCTKRICGPLVAELWPSDPPRILSIPATGFSAEHVKWVNDFKSSHGGVFIEPFLKKYAQTTDFNKVALVGFSAGCWGVREILSNPVDAARVSLAYACDGLHGQYASGGVKIQAPWAAFADRAVAGEVCMIDSFSAIVPPGYPGTQETAHAIASHYDMTWMESGAVLIGDDLPAQQVSSLGEMHLIGAWPMGTKGNDAAAHIYQANKVQEAVWKGIIAPYLQHGPVAPTAPNSGGLATKIAVAGLALAAGILGWQLYEAMRA
jgi:hypothetical protein